jgi:acyl-CoA thioesterase I
MPPNYGEVYAQSFEALFRELARTHRTALVEFLLEDFADKPEFFLPDRIHPSEQAQPLMLDRVWTVLRPLLK